MPNELACYIRLSHADDDLDTDQYESASISNQRELIHRYISAHPEFAGWQIHEFVDDGYSGTTENRPEFQRMIRLTRQGRIQCIIVKDFSRFARNYVTMGDYLEQIFPYLGVRFISVNDCYDSAVSTNIADNMSMVLKSILNSYYSRDLSAKMFTCNTQRMKNGEFVGTPCYGYMLNQERNQIIIDPNAAPVVRQIYDLALSGKTRTEIVKILNDQCIATPAEYNRQRGEGRAVMVTSHPLWDHVKVSRILREEAYTGKLVMRKYVKAAPCAKKRIKADPSQQFIREHNHEPIVSQEEFDRVQEMIPKRKGWNRQNQRQYPLKGLVRCGTCGKVMFLRQNKHIGMLQCPESTLEHSVCPSKQYSYQEVEQTVLAAIKPFLKRIIQEEKKYSRSKAADRASKCEDKIRQLQQEMKRLRQQKTLSYEQYVAGVITQEEYLHQKNEFGRQGQRLDDEISALKEQEAMLTLSTIPADLQQAADYAKTYLDCDALTREMAVSFVKAVCLFEDHIDIRWKFADLFEQLGMNGSLEKEHTNDQ